MLLYTRHLTVPIVRNSFASQWRQRFGFLFATLAHVTWECSSVLARWLLPVNFVWQRVKWCRFDVFCSFIQRYTPIMWYSSAIKLRPPDVGTVHTTRHSCILTRQRASPLMVTSPVVPSGSSFLYCLCLTSSPVLQLLMFELFGASFYLRSFPSAWIFK